MKATEHLYYQDPLLLAFDAEVVAHASRKGSPSVVLDRSAFYAEAGGQMADRGELHGRRVVDVQADDDGRVHHVIEGELPAVGARVHGEVDRARRRVHMALHTGQHMLSRALTDLAGAATLSARLGESGCTIDLDRDAVDERRVAESEALVNSVIEDDIVVRAFFPTKEELATIPLRSAPKVLDDIRIVAVGDFDFTPCGGTHCTRTAQIGLVRVTGIERHKGRSRVLFSAGARARGEVLAEAALLRELSRSLSCGPRDVPAGVDRLRRDLTEVRDALARAEAQVLDRVAAELAQKAAAEGRVVAVLDGTAPEGLRALANKITATPGVVAFLAGRSGDGLSILVARGSGATLDCGAFLKKIAKMAGGRGGGKPERAEGRVPAGADWTALVEAASTSA